MKVTKIYNLKMLPTPRGNQLINYKNILFFQNINKYIRCLNSGLKAAQELVEVIPQFKYQLENWDLVLNSWLHLGKSLKNK